MTQRSRIFISYRREDSEHAAGRLADDLRKEFPPQQIFLDVASIDPGADFVQALKQGLEDCAAVLVVIGPRWLTATDERGQRRIDSPDDWVRQEIAVSLQQPGVRVIPILLDTEIPNAGSLPEDIRPLTRRQALPLTNRHWANDVAQLIELLKKSSRLEAPPDRAKRMQQPELAGTGHLRRRAVRWGVTGMVLVILAAAGTIVFRPSMIGMRTVAIAGPKPLYAPYKTGDVFQECAECPEMVVIVPAKTQAGGGLQDSSTPALKPFAIGKYEVTRAQFFSSGVALGQGCWDKAGDKEKMGARNSKSPGFEQPDNHPVVCVNINDIRNYLAWLNSRTNEIAVYRLPSGAEWFYAAMAGTGDVDPWGEDRSRACEYANVHDLTAAGGRGASSTFDCTDEFAFTAPVGRFKPNAWGLHDTMGNVAEWLQDCGRREPQEETCERFRKVAGARYDESLLDDRRFLIEQAEGNRKNSIGFRVARYL